MRQFFPFMLALALPLETDAATLQVDLQPVRICIAEGCAEPTFAKRYLKQIWAQTDIRVKVLRPVSSDILEIETDALEDLDANDALYDFAFWQMDQGLRPGTAYMGFTGPLAGSTLGLAFVNEPELTLFPYGIAEALDGRYGAAVVAHELGHILGARHVGGVSLMSPSITRSHYDDAGFLPTIGDDLFQTIRTSPLLIPASLVADPAPVPLPSAAPALVGSVLLLAAWKVRLGRA